MFTLDKCLPALHGQLNPTGDVGYPEPEVSSHQSMVQNLFLKDEEQSSFVFRDATSWHPKEISGQEGRWFCSLNITRQTPS